MFLTIRERLLTVGEDLITLQDLEPLGLVQGFESPDLPSLFLHFSRTVASFLFLTLGGV